jgi:L-ribulose-5-phosphate 3-epimerase
MLTSATAMTRRTVLCAALSPLIRAERLPIRKAVEFNMLPESMTIAGRFQLAREAGFERIECPTTPEPERAREMLEASQAAGLPIHSVMNMAHWDYPLSSPDRAVVEKSLDGMRTSLHNAKLWGADTVLLVPAVVTAETSYAQAWERSQRAIKSLIPLAAELGAVIAIEEVWNKFLQSPLEFARYIDEFESPMIRAYFDVGNVAINGYPQDWIRTLGARIVKLHIKDFRFRNRVAEFVPLGEGDINWAAVHAALAGVHFSGTATVELGGGDADYLKEVNRRFDRILNGS